MPLPYDEKGSLLVADLTEKKTIIKPIPRDIHSKYYLGLGYNTWLLNQKTSPNTDPFGAENIVIISPGNQTAIGSQGHGVMSAGRDGCEVVACWGIANLPTGIPAP